MEAIEITTEFLKKYFKEKKYHKGYKLTCDTDEEICLHADGDYPKKLIHDRRPSESAAIMAYRKTIYQKITKTPFGKIINSLSKIRRSPDWAIKWDPTIKHANIIDEESLETYCDKVYPEYSSITNWYFNAGLKNYLVHANGVVAIIPMEFTLESTGYIKPIAINFTAAQVLEYKENQIAVLKSTDKATYKDDKGNEKYDGDVFYVLTTKETWRFAQVNAKGDIDEQGYIQHNIGVLPCFKNKGIFKENLDMTSIWESRLNPVVPFFNEAVREYSDLQAEVVQHIHSEKWLYKTKNCKTCNGVGKKAQAGFVNPGESNIIECPDCGGSGEMKHSPYDNLVIRPTEVGQSPAPNPPAGYIQKDVEIVKIQDERVDKHIYKGLSGINMEFLADSPLQQSGLAKSVDKDELNSFVHSIAEDSVSIIDRVYFFINEYRNMEAVPSAQDRIAMLPKIPVPEKFDILSTNFLLEEIGKAKVSKTNVVVINAMEIEYTSKKFSNNTDVRDELTLVLELDPFPGLIDDDKVIRLQNNGITELDYIISCNIQQFVRRAMKDDKNFATNPFAANRKKMEEYAQEVIDANSVAKEILTDAIPAFGEPAAPPDNTALPPVKKGVV